MKKTNTNKKCKKHKRNRHTKNRATTRGGGRNWNNWSATIYITELMEDWNKIKLIERNFESIRNSELNKAIPNWEIVIQTTLKNKNTLNWLADTGSPRVLSISIQQKTSYKKRKTNNWRRKTYKRNSNVSIIGINQQSANSTWSSGSWNATNCNVLVVRHKPQNVTGRDIVANGDLL